MGAIAPIERHYCSLRKNYSTLISRPLDCSVLGKTIVKTPSSNFDVIFSKSTGPGSENS